MTLYSLTPKSKKLLKFLFSCHLFFISFKFSIWVFLTGAEGTLILEAVKPESQDRSSNQGTTV